MCKAVIFDMDGLMFDTEKIYSRAWAYAGEKIGYKIDDEFLNPLRGANRKMCVEYFRERLGSSFDYEYARRIRSEYVQKYLEKEGIPCKPGLYELMNFLKEKNFKIALATSTFKKEAERYLHMADVYKYFDVLVYGDMVARGKPHPDIYLKASEYINESPGNCFVLEDSCNGVLSAASAGCRVIMVPDEVEPDYEISCLLYKKCNSLNDVIECIKAEFIC
ncbi:HAD family phosphatase [Petroclostridium sp. X23]|nr:HAD family phosphatase [Petroclostridium sp. X23]WHH57152.1 HAD family phosphatase [Petroclostridium sp. X23]